MPESKNGKKGRTLAERLLKQARDSHWPISVYLANGFQLKGEVVDFDKESILINHKGAHQLVMRTGVASMYPLPSAKGETEAWWNSHASAEALAPAKA